MAVSDINVLNLQFTASLLMGYDYFLSETLKRKLNESASDYVKSRQDNIDEMLRNRARTFISVRPVLFAGIILALLFWGSLSMMKIAGKLWGAYGVIILAILALLFLMAATRPLITAFAEGVLPLTAQAIFRAVTSFLLFSSKGVIAAFGLIFLLASFACRYYNVLHH